VALGNPPWEVSQLSEEEFFASRDVDVARLAGAERKAAIKRLEWAKPWLWHEYSDEKRGLEAANAFYRASERFQKTARGKINSYALFAETFLNVVSQAGRAGFLVPTGIATDNSTKAFFDELVSKRRLANLLAFENEEFIFRAVHHSYRFCLVTLGYAESAIFVFFARQPQHVHDERRRFTLVPKEFALINPNTRTCPIFRSQADAELIKKLYREVPVLIDENEQLPYGWRVLLIQNFFSTSNIIDQALFVPADRASGRHDLLLRVLRGTMIDHFDHRAATYGLGRGDFKSVDAEEKKNPHLSTAADKYISKSEVEQRLREKGWEKNWLLG
jgi:hypothetical protein